MTHKDQSEEDFDRTIPSDLSQVGADPETLPTIGGPQGGDATVSMHGAAAPSVSIGTPEIPGYEIIRVLGEGGMGVVYEARQIALNRIVALKVLKPAVASEPEFRERFLRESAAAAKVAHANVVQIFDAGEAAGHLYMTFQKIDGGDLADLIKAKGSISEYKSLSIIKECLLGLQAIDQAGLVHRDIKPGNIFMEQGRRPVIGDLGLARQTSGDDRMTMTGAAMGTPSYMSPEHIQGVSDIDIRTDLYALGSTLYKMVTGEEPFQGETVYAITHSIISQPIPDPRELNASLSNPIVGIIRKSMEKDRQQRYQNAEQFIQDIDAALGGHQLIYADGFGTIEGVEQPKAPATPDKPSPVSFSPAAKSQPSFLRAWIKPIIIVLLILWFVFLIDSLKLDMSRYEPDWASAHGKDNFGRYVILDVGQQSQKFRLVRGSTKQISVVLGAAKTEDGYRENERMTTAQLNHDYWIADSEVTQALWSELMDVNPSSYKNSYFPVHNVSYGEVQTFIEKLNALIKNASHKSPFKARLPSELEWELAARAGVEFMPYGDQEEPTAVAKTALTPLRAEWERLYGDEQTAAADREQAIWDFIDGHSQAAWGPGVVKVLQANRWGLYDMHGNVAELCSDDWDGVSPHGAAGSGFKPLRGGSWFHHPWRCRSACREPIAANEAVVFGGFRLLIELPAKTP